MFQQFKIHLVFIILFIFLTTSCRRNFQYSVLEVKPLDRMINPKAIEQINQLSPQDTFGFLIISDSQVAYKELEAFVKHVNSNYSTDSISFIVHGGDFTDYGANFEYNLYYDEIKELHFPIVGCIGNHDMLGNGQAVFGRLFGPENFTFAYGDNNFIFFNNNGREVGFDHTLPNMDWLIAEVKRTTQNNIFFISHVPPVSSDFDPALKDDFTNLLATTPKNILSIHGHTHSYAYGEFFQDSVPYLVVPTLQKKKYVKVTVRGDNIAVQQKQF